MNKEQKAQAVDEIAARISESNAIYATDYRGITVAQAAALRARLRDAGASFRVVKNTLTLRAADKAGAEDVKQLVEGPTAFAFVQGDPALAAKALDTFARQENVLDVRGGLLDGALLDGDAFRSLASRRNASPSSRAPSRRPPLTSSTFSWRAKTSSALAASAGSPATKVNAVGPSTSRLTSSAPALSAARRVSVFLTTRKLAPASRSRVRSLAACATVMPL